MADACPRREQGLPCLTCDTIDRQEAFAGLPTNHVPHDYEVNASAIKFAMVSRLKQLLNAVESCTIDLFEAELKENHPDNLTFEEICDCACRAHIKTIERN